MTRGIAALCVSIGVLAVALAGCGGSSSTSSSTARAPAAPSTGSTAPTTSATVSTASVSKLGQVLVDGRGHTLYVFLPDAHAKVTCTGACAQVWPPLKLQSGQGPTASGQAKASLLGSDPDPEGGRVATYARWPLYTYAGDSGPGTASGQGLNINGGLWYVIAASGTVVKAAP